MSSLAPPATPTPAAVAARSADDTLTLRAASWRGAPDWALLAGLVACAVAIAFADISAGERVVPITALVAVSLGWIRSLLQRWSVQGDVLRRDGWLVRRTVDVSETTAVVLTDDEGSPDEVCFRNGLVGVSIRLDEARAEPAFLAELRRLAVLAHADDAVLAVLSA